MVNLTRDTLLESDLIYGDETTIQVLKESGRWPQGEELHMDAGQRFGPSVRMFSSSPELGAQYAQKLYADVPSRTALMTDGYKLYNGIAHNYRLVPLGCWAHVRRGFVKAEESVPKAARSPELLATHFIALIGKLFAIEACSEVDARTPTTVACAIQRPRARHGRLRQHKTRLLINAR
ncbi:IS66 family transposase [Burkholderia territorii]|uniref:IS66 family transposase n=1 Tax=Burkholderia territorii TaxID=1503055 RepID=UPI0018C4F7A5|nr:transposase [Burkholderia territorii]